MTAALEEAAAFRQEADKLHGDPAKWKAALVEALSAVKRADGVLNGGEGTEELRGRVNAVRAELDLAERDRSMIAGLEAARFQEAAGGKEVMFDHAGASNQYAAAFRQDDPNWEALGVDEAAARIKQRAIKDDLLAALSNWSNITPNEREREKLSRIVLAADPDPESFRNRWNAALEQRDWHTLQVLAINPEMMDQPTYAAGVYGRAMVQAGDPAGAATLLKDANERHPGDFWINFELACTYLQAKPTAVDEAIRYFTASVALRPSSSAAHNNLGIVLKDKGRLDEAAAEYRKAIELQPHYPYPHNNLGNALRDKGRFDEAIAEFRKTVQIQPNSAMAHKNLGVALYNEHQLDAAIAEYRKAVELKPDVAMAHFDLGNALYNKHQWDEAIAEFRKALQIQPDDADAAYNAACAAALAASGLGEDPAKADEKERSRWRKQALDWLRTALTLWTKKIDDGKPEDRAAAAKELKHWQEDSDLAGVRDKDALAKLPADEQDAWRKLWADVDALLKKAQEK